MAEGRVSGLVSPAWSTGSGALLLTGVGRPAGCLTFLVRDARGFLFAAGSFVAVVGSLLGRCVLGKLIGAFAFLIGHETVIARLGA
jgi:hypothetical protein